MKNSSPCLTLFFPALLYCLKPAVVRAWLILVNHTQVIYPDC